GTAFVLTKESGAHPLHKESIIEASGDDTVLTNVFSGKYARGIRNDFIDEMNQKNPALPTYPIQNVLTQPLRKAAKAENDSGLMSLWSGQGASLGRKQTVKVLIQELMENNASNY